MCVCAYIHADSYMAWRAFLVGNSGSFQERGLGLEWGVCMRADQSLVLDTLLIMNI